MGLFKWLCKKFSCKSECRYNEQMKECPEIINSRIANIHNYKLNIEDYFKINKILTKRPTIDRIGDVIV